MKKFVITVTLDADGQPARCPPDRGAQRRQPGQRRLRHPERLVGIGPVPFGGGDRAGLERPGVVREGRGEAGRAQEHVGVVEGVPEPALV